MYSAYWPELALQKGFTDKVMLVFTIAIFPQESTSPGDMEAVLQVMSVVWGSWGPVLVCDLRGKNDNSDSALFPYEREVKVREAWKWIVNAHVALLVHVFEFQTSKSKIINENKEMIH